MGFVILRVTTDHLLAISLVDMTDFLAGKLFEKAKKGMSAKEIAKRWSVVTRKMTNELRFTQPDGTIYPNFWGEVVIAATKFFDGNQQWVAQLINTATRRTGPH